MSLFGMVGDMDDDPLMGGHFRRMNTFMNSFFRDPFADMFGGGRGGMLSIGGPAGLGGELMPFTGGRSMHSPAAMMLSGGFSNLLDHMGGAGNSHVSSMSTVMTMTQGPDGRPQVYQASQSVRQGPNGVRETKKTVADSRTGVKKMSIGRHVYDRGHIIEREQNIYSGEREENEEFINLEEDEADDFQKEWATKARHVASGNRGHQAAIGYGGNGSHRRRHYHGGNPQLALPPSTSAVPAQPAPRYVGRSGRRSAYGGPNNQLHQPSIASAIAASQELSDSDSDEPSVKRKRSLKPPSSAGADQNRRHHHHYTPPSSAVAQNRHQRRKNQDVTESITIHEIDDEDEEEGAGDVNNDDAEEVGGVVGYVDDDVEDDDDDDVDDDDDSVDEVIDLVNSDHVEPSSSVNKKSNK